MPASIGVNLRVTGHCSQGGRKYMEDLFSVAYQQTEDERDLEYAFFGIYDGHGGREAAAFAKEHLMDSIVKQRQFWSDDDEDVLKAIRNGYMLTHLNMWKEIDKWPKTVTGLPSTAGTTASIAFIRRGKIYIGHVGDSAIVLGYQNEGSDDWEARPLTMDHKPESATEMERIESCGGKVVSKAGVPRVVWNRPRQGHKGPISKNTPVDEIPFLAVARSLGDLWSYNIHNDEFVVSPEPDVGVLTIDPSKFRCLIFGTDGLWNMTSPKAAVDIVRATEKHNENALVAGASAGGQPRDWLNPSKSLVDSALEKWSSTRMRADNTSVVTLMLDPPGPPRAAVLRARTAPKVAQEPPRVPQNGLTIVTRYSDSDRPQPTQPNPAVPETPTPSPPVEPLPSNPEALIANYGDPGESMFIARFLNRNTVVNTLSNVYEEIVGESVPEDLHVFSSERTSLAPEDVPEPASEIPVCSTTEVEEDKSSEEINSSPDEESIQINEVSSSSPIEAAPKSKGRKPRTISDPQPIVSGRTLRSHDAESPQRPRTRLGTNRDRKTTRAPDTTTVASRTRAGQTVLQQPNVQLLTRQHQLPKVSSDTKVVILQKSDTTVRHTRSRDVLPTIAQSTTVPRRDFNGNKKIVSSTDITSECSKENFVSRGAGGGRAARRGRREGSASLVGLYERPRALRSRNEPAPDARGKRSARSDDSAPPHKIAKVSLSPRWPIMRNRLRRKMVK